MVESSMEHERKFDRLRREFVEVVTFLLFQHDKEYFCVTKQHSYKICLAITIDYLKMLFFF